MLATLLCNMGSLAAACGPLHLQCIQHGRQRHTHGSGKGGVTSGSLLAALLRNDPFPRHGYNHTPGSTSAIRPVLSQTASYQPAQGGVPKLPFNCPSFRTRKVPKKCASTQLSMCMEYIPQAIINRFQFLIDTLFMHICGYFGRLFGTGSGQVR